MLITPFHPKRFTESELFIAKLDDKSFLLKTYIGNHAILRQEMEQTKLAHWRYHQFPVPNTFQIDIPPVKQPYLLMEYIDGQALSEYLKQSSITDDEKLSLLTQIFRCNAKRHQLALDLSDLHLIHTDPNTDNILIKDHEFFYIDFEHRVKEKTIVVAIAQEIATFCRRICTDFGREQIDTIIRLMLAEYNNQEIIQKVISLTTERPFQIIHRTKDQRKKQKNPAIITRYDIVDAIKKLALI